MYNNAIPNHFFTSSSQYIDASKPFCNSCGDARYQLGLEILQYCCVDFTAHPTVTFKITFQFTTFIRHVAVYTYGSYIANNMTVEYSYVDKESEFRFISSSTGAHQEVSLC